MAKLTFRPQALEKLASPEQLDQLVRVVTPRNWLALAGLACLLLPIIAWALWGKLETQVIAQGILLPEDGLCAARAMSDGLVTDMAAAVGDRVEAGQRLANLQPVGGASIEINSPCAGKVVYQSAWPGDPVLRAANILVIERNSQVLEVVAYVSIEQARSIGSGMLARISPESSEKERYGYLLGRVKSVALYPVTFDRLVLQVGSDDLARSFLQDEVLVEVHISLGHEPGREKWSLADSAHPSLLSGAICEVKIVTDSSSPLKMIFPAFNHP
jgi:hypothetical protein